MLHENPVNEMAVVTRFAVRIVNRVNSYCPSRISNNDMVVYNQLSGPLVANTHFYKQ